MGDVGGGGGDSRSVDDKIGKKFVGYSSVWTGVSGWASENSEISAEKPSLAK